MGRSKSNVSELVRGAGMAADAWSRLYDRLTIRGGKDSCLHMLARDDGRVMNDVIAELLIKAEAATAEAYPITVDYTKSLEEMIRVGKYREVNPLIDRKNFPIKGSRGGDP